MPGDKSNSTIQRFRTRGGTLLRISGFIDETFQVDDFASGAHGVLVVDLDGVKRITSFGIREWITALQRLRADYYCFINCTPPIVSQLNMVAGFIGTGEVISFHIPYLCRQCNATSSEVLDLRRADHREIVASLEPPLTTCSKCGADSEFDDLPDLYFQYFRGAPLPHPPALANNIIDGRDSGQSFNIEKHIADTVTGVWLSGSLNRAPYFRYLADGLQGDVVLVTADIDSVNSDGLRGFTDFLRTPELSSYVARVPPVLVASLAEHGAELGAAKVASLMAPCDCAQCHRDVLIEIGRSALGELVETGTLNANCPDCTSMVSASVDAEWVSAAQALPVADMPDVVSRYLSERPRGPTPEPAATGRAATPSSLADRYKIQRRLGAGGMGDVFLARRVGPAGFEKLVVIKRIRADRVEDGDAVDSFLQEARLAARLSHPNIVQIFDLGKISDEYFISMEYVDGLDLRTVLRINEQMNLQMPVAICCRIISDLCQALYDAHSHRDESGELRPIIHRDVSPGNVLLSQSGVAKLTDFGIAKAGDSELETKSGVIKGTMRYIPPEVLRGPRSKTLHPRIDVYGAAILLYECLAGKPLFAGDNWVHTLRSILRQPVPKLSQVREGIAPQLEQTFERAIARDPKRRYQSVKELLDDLEAAIESAGYAVTNNTLSKWVRQMLDHKKNLDADESDPSAAPSAGDDGSDADDLSNSRANTR